MQLERHTLKHTALVFFAPHQIVMAYTVSHGVDGLDPRLLLKQGPSGAVRRVSSRVLQSQTAS